MIILITGGCGFIGSNLCKKLLDEGNTVICVDNNYSSNVTNISQFMDNENFTFINHDIIDKLEIESNIHQIYHLACPASPPIYQKDPLYTIKTGVFGTYNIIELAREKNATILYSSTSEVYGDPNVNPQSEEYWGNVNPIGIRSCYDESKRMGETMLMEYRNKFNLNTKIARIFNTYGPNMDKNDGRVVSNFINQYLNNDDITIYGDGTQTRSFCYVSDTVDGLVKLMNSEYNVKGPINIGNPNEITIKDLTTKIKKLLPLSKSNIKYLDLPSDDPLQRKPNISKAKELLEWYPNISLEEGLTNTILYFHIL